jgi:hypothetical protein
MYITQDEVNVLTNEQLVETINMFSGAIVDTAVSDRHQALRYCNTVNYLTNTLRERIKTNSLTIDPIYNIM